MVIERPYRCVKNTFHALFHWLLNYRTLPTLVLSLVSFYRAMLNKGHTAIRYQSQFFVVVGLRSLTITVVQVPPRSNNECGVKLFPCSSLNHPPDSSSELHTSHLRVHLADVCSTEDKLCWDVGLSLHHLLF